MGIEPDIEYGNNCLCWDAGKTPKGILLTFAGIEKGSLWNPGFPEPPNRRHVCMQGIPCSFTKNTPDFIYNYQTNLPGSQISIFYWPIGFFAFNFLDVANCVFAGSNSIAVPLNKIWYGGNCQITWQD